MSSQLPDPSAFLHAIGEAMDTVHAAHTVLPDNDDERIPDEPFAVIQRRPQMPFGDNAITIEKPAAPEDDHGPMPQILDLKHEQLLRKLNEIQDELNAVKQLIPRVDTIGQQTQWITQQVQFVLAAMTQNPMAKMILKRMGGTP